MWLLIDTAQQTGERIGHVIAQHRTLTRAIVESIRHNAEQDKRGKGAPMNSRRRARSVVVWHSARVWRLGSPVRWDDPCVRPLTSTQLEKLTAAEKVAG